MAKVDLTNSTNLFKINYGPLSENTYNSKNVTLGRVKKNYKFTGKRKDIAIPTSFIGGVGSGSLPTANYQSVADAQITAKKVYARCQIEREAIKAANDDAGSFVRMTKNAVKQTVDSYMRNMSRILFNDGTGALGVTSAAAAGGTATAPTVVISAATWKEANFEERDFINVNSSNNAYAVSAQWEITKVDASTRTLTLARSLGSVDLTGDTAAKTLYMQNSKDNDPQGLKGVCDATSGTKYAVDIARRFQAYQKAASSTTINEDVINEVVLEMERLCGEAPNLLVTSYKQYRKLLNVSEDKKTYEVGPRYGSEELKAKISFKGLQVMTPKGPVGVYADRFVEDDRMYFLNDDYIEFHHRPDFGWFDDDGTVFLRVADSDDYEARYGGYMECLIIPSFQGVITGLA